MRRSLLALAGGFLLAAPLAAQGPRGGKFPPDSLVNTRVFPPDTPVPQVLNAMRGFAGALGVRCVFCHEGEEGQPLSAFDFPSDKKETKLIARQMMRMVEEIDRRVDTLPGRAAGDPTVSCVTCHRGVSVPEPLPQLLADVAQSAGADSAVRAYKALRQRYYGHDAYDFGENSLPAAALRLAQGSKFPEAMALLSLNEENFPNSAPTAVARGSVLLMQGDTGGAVTAFREALKRDSTSFEARGQLRRLGKTP
jgi:hypothetical protein